MQFRGAKVIIRDGDDPEDIKEEIHQAWLDLQEMKRNRGADGFMAQLCGGGRWRVQSHAGIDTIFMLGKPEGGKEEEKKKKVIVKLRQQLTLYIQSTEEGLVLCGTPGTFDGPYSGYDPLGIVPRSATWFYAPYAYPITEANDIYYYDPPPELGDDEQLLEWKLADDPHKLPTIESKMPTGPAYQESYEEPDFYSRLWSPAYWDSYADYYALQQSDYNAASDITYMGFEYISEEIENTGVQTLMNVLWTFGWGIVPTSGWAKHTYEKRVWRKGIMVNGTVVIEGTTLYEIDSHSNDNGEDTWHTMLYPVNPSPYYWWEDYAGPVSGTVFKSTYRYEYTKNTIGLDYRLLGYASNMADKWGVVYTKKIVTGLIHNYPDPAWWNSAPGTHRYDIHIDTEETVWEAYYADSNGNHILLDSGDDSNFSYNSRGYVRIYLDVMGKDIFLFNYDQNYLYNGVPRCAGIAIGNEVKTTDMNHIDVGDTHYYRMSGGRYLGLILRKFKEIIRE